MKSIYQIVSASLASAELGPHERKRFTIFAYRFFRDYRLQADGEFKNLVREMDHSLQIALPEDFVAVVRLGLIDAEGNITPLGDYTPLHSDTGSPAMGTARHTQGTLPGVPVMDIREAQMGGIDKAQVSWTKKRYEIDHHTHALRFSAGTPKGKVAMRYLSNCIDDDEKAVVRPITESAMEDFILHRHFSLKHDPRQYSALDRLEQSITELNRQLCPITEENIRDFLNENEI